MAFPPQIPHPRVPRRPRHPRLPSPHTQQTSSSLAPGVGKTSSGARRARRPERRRRDQGPPTHVCGRTAEKVVQALKRVGSVNAVVFMKEEVDEVGRGVNGDPCRRYTVDEWLGEVEVHETCVEAAFEVLECNRTLDFIVGKPWLHS
ncbi:hypothetical protein B0H12DRAFT_1080364, partial [Mycena haematopus]